ncbi:hypothetical protein [Frigoriglobus tundricola]|uniref:Lipocalin-like domain-containing protein n=1 Tax=Frigoriglobus tundricola TaxID=2774151 RepID=A0A6M5YVN9_9BACT|nr:hypothetical protein [Frigoriglobus tundricola]QJW97580.1 hypothetical protein FTUN_5155 [Frigoriglobus tundricola]
MTRYALVSLAALAFAGAAGAQSPDLTGKWSGYWASDKNGHTGPLNATFVPQGDSSYRVTYRGRFAKVIPFRYSTTMDVVGTGDGVVLLSAEKRLGPMGTFRTTATATGSNFDATFTSRRDSGRFVLSRR